jgi:hypothetical protein
VLVDDQKLRNLCQKNEFQGSEDVVTECVHCSKTWSSDEIVQAHLNYQGNPHHVVNFPDGEERRLKSMAVEYQRRKGNNSHPTS